MSDKKQSRPTPPQPTQRPQPLRESTRDTGAHIGQQGNVRKGDQTINFSPPPPPPPRPQK